MNTYALIGTGISKKYPTISKMYCYHPNELCAERGQHLIAPYMKTDLITCESLLATKEALRVGIPPWKILYLPHTYPIELESIAEKTEEDNLCYRNDYIKRIAQENQKEVEIFEDTLLIGFSSRFHRGKNVEFLIGAISELVKIHPNIILLVKGDMSAHWDFGSEYSEKLKDAFSQISTVPWFLWDRSFTDFPEVFHIYKSFDLFVYPSGAENGSNTLVETLSLGVPTIALEASTNPYLFNNMLLFAKAGEFLKGKVNFYQPDFADLLTKMRMLIGSPKLRKQLGQEALKLSKKRFAPEVLSKRLPLLLESARSYHNHDQNEESYRKKIIQLIEEDFSNYELSL